MKSALVTIARIARVPMMRPTNSRGWPAIAAASTLGDKLDEIACAGPAPAFERQPDRHALPLADPALDRDVAPMQMRQALDDRQTKPRAVAAMFTGGTRLEESFSQTRQIVFIDSDSVVLDRHYKSRSFTR